jgi:dihydrofolate reductase
LLQTLIAHDLVDQFRLWTFPVLLGHGKRLFGEGVTPRALVLVKAVTSSSGVLMATYRRAGDVDHGSFEFDDPTAEELERRRHLSTG